MTETGGTLEKSKPPGRSAPMPSDPGQISPGPSAGKGSAGWTGAGFRAGGCGSSGGEWNPTARTGGAAVAGTETRRGSSAGRTCTGSRITTGTVGSWARPGLSPPAPAAAPRPASASTLITLRHVLMPLVPCSRGPAWGRSHRHNRTNDRTVITGLLSLIGTVNQQVLVN